MLHKALPTDAQFKMTDSASGGFGMYLSTFANYDRVRPIPERPVKGAFTPHLAAFIKDGFIAYAHDWEHIPIATVTAATEDEYGLWVEAEFHSTAFAQDVRTTIKERQERGKSVKSSMGYDVLDRRYVAMDDPALLADGIPRGCELLDIPLYEGSIVNVPANNLADVAGVKGLTRRASGLLTLVKDLYAGTPDSWEVQETLLTLLAYVQQGRMLQDADPTALMLVSNQLRDAQIVVAALLAAPDAEKAAPVARVPFPLEVTHAEAALRRLVARAKHQAANRTKAGRRLSAATDSRLADVETALSTAIPALQEALEDVQEVRAGVQTPDDDDAADTPTAAKPRKPKPAPDMAPAKTAAALYAEFLQLQTRSAQLRGAYLHG